MLGGVAQERAGPSKQQWENMVVLGRERTGKEGCFYTDEAGEFGGCRGGVELCQPRSVAGDEQGLSLFGSVAAMWVF